MRNNEELKSLVAIQNARLEKLKEYKFALKLINIFELTSMAE